MSSLTTRQRETQAFILRTDTESINLCLHRADTVLHTADTLCSNKTISVVNKTTSPAVNNETTVSVNNKQTLNKRITRDPQKPTDQLYICLCVCVVWVRKTEFKLKVVILSVYDLN